MWEEHDLTSSLKSCHAKVRQQDSPNQGRSRAHTAGTGWGLWPGGSPAADWPAGWGGEGWGAAPGAEQGPPAASLPRGQCKPCDPLFDFSN